MTIRGGAAGDVITGGPASDEVFGDHGEENRSGDGDDTISTGAGNDQVSGEGGNDHLDSGDGSDVISGQEGNVTVSAGPGDDQVENLGQSLSSGRNIEGDAGDDVVDAGAGKDPVISLLGRDTVRAGQGNDSVVVAALAWNDRRQAAKADCGAGNDTFAAGVGDVVAGCERYETEAFCAVGQRSCRYVVAIGTLIGRRPVIFAKRSGRAGQSSKAEYLPLGSRARALAARLGGVKVRAQLQVLPGGGGRGFLSPLYLFTLRSKV